MSRKLELIYLNEMRRIDRINQEIRTEAYLDIRLRTVELKKRSVDWHIGGFRLYSEHPERLLRATKLYPRIDDYVVVRPSTRVFFDTMAQEWLKEGKLPSQP